MLASRRVRSNSKASDPDNLSPQVLKELSAQIADPHGLIFQKSLDEGVVSTDWCQANVAPVSKNGHDAYYL